MDIGDVQAQIQTRGKGLEAMEQAHRVDAAGDGHHRPLAGCEQGGVADQGANRADQRGCAS